MEPERWKRIEDLYHAALDRDESARAAFLQKSCNGEDDPCAAKWNRSSTIASAPIASSKRPHWN